MKKIIAGAAGIALWAAGATAIAQVSDSETFNVASNVSQECEVDVVSTNINLTYTLDQTVADMTLECNLYSVLDIQFGSTDGNFALTGPNGLTVPYSLDVNANDSFLFIEPTALDNQFAPFIGQIDNQGGILLQPQGLEIRVNMDPSQDIGGLFAGSYSDDIRIDIRPAA